MITTNMEKISNLGKKISLKNKEFTIFENGVEHRPFLLRNEKEEIFYLMLKDTRSVNYTLIDWKFNTLFSVTKEELELAINPPVVNTSWHTGNVLSWSVHSNTNTAHGPNIVSVP